MTSKIVDRRSFIGQASMAACGLLLPRSFHNFSIEPRKLGIALVGLGKYSTNQLAPALKLTQYCKLAGVVTGTFGIISYLANKQIMFIEVLREKTKKINKSELYKNAVINPENNLGSVIAVMFMAYLGATLPLLILFNINPGVPFWVTFNSEFIIEEVIRILVSLSAIVLTIPITTFLAINFLPKK